MTSTYVTPRTPRQAILNALSEIEENQIRDHKEQAEIILFHILDYQGGRIMVWMFHKLTMWEWIKLMFEHEDLDTDADEEKKAA